MYNYQAQEDDPAVLAVLVSAHGSSAQIVDRKWDGSSCEHLEAHAFCPSHRRLLFRKNNFVKAILSSLIRVSVTRWECMVTEPLRNPIGHLILHRSRLSDFFGPVEDPPKQLADFLLWLRCR